MLDEPGRASSVLPRGDGPADVAREPSLARESGNAAIPGAEAGKSEACSCVVPNGRLNARCGTCGGEVRHVAGCAPDLDLVLRAQGSTGAARTSGMRLSELEHCSFCGDFAGHIFRLLDVRFAVIGRGAREVGALAVGLGLPLRIAEIFAPRPDEAIGIGEDPELVTRLFCCNACLMKPVNIAVAIERVTKAREETKSAGGHLPSAPDLDAVAEEQKIAEQTSGRENVGS